MSESIDRRVVEMRFDNKDFEQNVNTTMTVLDKLKEKLAFKGAGKDFEATSGLSGAIDGVRSRFSALEIIGTTALVNLTNSAMNLGKQLARSLTVDQVKAGFSEYELKMGSMQTIMASTGASVDVVNEKLNELNAYSDRTIYSFSDMTSNIGKFTNAGVELDDAVNAMKGISNEAALAGANANEASRAMYNFSQALSAGFVMNRDWMSIENANMATKGFKQQLIDTAVAMGTLKKTEEGYISTTTNAQGKTSDAFDAVSKFRDSLQAQWLTTDVLTQTLNNYSVDLENMTDAEVKAWREKMKTIGYTDEQIAGIEKLSKNAYAAAQDVKTFSQLMDTVKESIGSGWAQTFELLFGNLEEAKKLWTGVNEVISGFISRSADARNGILQIWKASNGRAALIDGFKELYRSIRSYIMPIGAAFRTVFDPIRGEQLTALSFRFRDFAKGLHASGETATKIRNIFTVLFSVLKSGLGIVKGVFSIFGSLVKLILPVGGTALDLMSSLSGAMMKMASGVDKITDKLAVLTKGLLGKAVDSIGKLFALLGKGLSHLDLGKLGAFLAGGGILAGGVKMVKFIDSLSEKFDGLFNIFGGGDEGGGPMDAIKGTFESLSETLNQFQTSLKVGQLITVAVALGILAASCATLADIQAKKLATAVAAIGGLFTELGIASHLMTGAQTKGIIQMSIAVILLSKAVKSLSEVENLGKGLLGVGAILGELTAFCLIFDRMKIKPKALAKTGEGLILMAVAINLLAKPIKELGALDTGQLIQGLLAMAAMLGGFTLTALAFSHIETKGITKAGLSMVIMATAMKILVKPLSELGAMDLSSLAKGLGAMGVALLELAGFTFIMSQIAASSGNIMKASAALLVMSIGIKIMASAISQMGADAGAGQGLSVLFGSLLILGVAMAAMQNSLAGAAAMVVVAGALMIMAPAIALLSSLDITGVMTGLAALAGTLIVFGVGAALLTPVIPVMIGLAAAMTLLGAGVLSLGAGMTLLVGAFAMATGPIINGAQAIAQAIPIIAKGIGDGFVAIVKAIGDSAETIKEAFIQIIDAILGALSESIPKLATFGLDMIIALLDAIRSHISEVTEIALDIIVRFVNGISEGLPDVTDAGINLIISLLNSMADSIAAYGPQLGYALANVVLAAIEALVSLIPGIGDKGKELIASYRKGLEDKAEKGKLDKSAKTVATDSDKNMKIKDQSSNGSNAVGGIVAGMNAMLPALRAKSREVSDIVDETMKKRNQIHSPSRRLARTGANLMKGLINGVDSMSGEYQNRADKISTLLVDSANKSVNGLSSTLAKGLSDSFGFDSSVDRAMTVSVSMDKFNDRNTALNSRLSKLTSTLDSMTESMNSRSLNNYITVDGTADPEAFADGLIRSFRLNARTV